MRAAAPADAATRPIIETVFTSLRQVGPPPPETPGTRLPVCRHFAPACDATARHSPALAGLTDAFRALEPRLRWTRRPDSEALDDHFAANHASVRIVGVGGIEHSDLVTVGASLLAPHTTYPDHHHPPEEVYLVLSPGEWRQRQDPWHAPGFGGLVHNPPDIIHAMRSLGEPLLAVWCLDLTGAAAKISA